MPRATTKTKKTALKKVSKAPIKGKKKKRGTFLEAHVLGIASEHVIPHIPLATPVSVHALPAQLVVVPPSNLPIQEKEIRTTLKERLHRPLVPYRVAFWMGVAFGMFVVGTLTIVAWQLLRVDAVEAVVIGLTRPQ